MEIMVFIPVISILLIRPQCLSYSCAPISLLFSSTKSSLSCWMLVSFKVNFSLPSYTMEAIGLVKLGESDDDMDFLHGGSDCLQKILLLGVWTCWMTWIHNKIGQPGQINWAPPPPIWNSLHRPANCSAFTSSWWSVDTSPSLRRNSKREREREKEREKEKESERVR